MWPGAELKEMPPPIKKFQSVGAEREPVETDRERVSDGYIVIEPLVVRDSMVIDNKKNIIALPLYHFIESLFSE